MITRRRTFSVLSSTVIMAALPLPAFAHRQKTTLSKIDWDPTDNSLNITHSYHMHDVETALAAKGVLDKPDIKSLRARAKLALYTEAQFKLSTGGEEIHLQILGAEYEARSVYVYQHVFLDKKPTELLVSASMLREIIPGQINHVDSWLADSVKSIAFKDGDGPKKIVT